MKKYRVRKKMLLEVKEEGNVRKGAKGKREDEKGNLLSHLSTLSSFFFRLFFVFSFSLFVARV